MDRDRRVAFRKPTGLTVGISLLGGAALLALEPLIQECLSPGPEHVMAIFFGGILAAFGIAVLLVPLPIAKLAVIGSAVMFAYLGPWFIVPFLYVVANGVGWSLIAKHRGLTPVAALFGIGQIFVRGRLT